MIGSSPQASSRSSPFPPPSLRGCSAPPRRLGDAVRLENSIEGRFDLTYNAAHSFALAAMRWHGYRPDKRYIVFQALAHTLSLPAAQWRVLDDAHRKRNAVEYEGTTEIDLPFFESLLRVTQEVAARVRALGPAGSGS